MFTVLNIFVKKHVTAKSRDLVSDFWRPDPDVLADTQPTMSKHAEHMAARCLLILSFELLSRRRIDLLIT